MRDVRNEQNNGLGSNPGREHSPHKDRGTKKPSMFPAKIGCRAAADCTKGEENGEEIEED